MEAVCRDRYGLLPVSYFKIFTCSMCYQYLFHTGGQLVPDSRQPWKLKSVTGSAYPDNFTIIPDVTNATSNSLVCRSLTESDCNRWTDCCNSAITCCQRQQSVPQRNETEGSFCPRTWDGYSCFDDTLPSARSYITCPYYIEHSSPSATAYKDCTENGTWASNPETGSEWTNYTTCVGKHAFHTVTQVALACNVTSLVFLIPACFIFLCIRQLRSQKRIKLHLCLFLSFILTAVITILWDVIVYTDRLKNIKQNSIMHRNSAGCKLLYILTRYCGTTNFFWMFCEGFYLHRLIVHAFAVPKTLVPYYVFGWVASWVPSAIYAIIRVSNSDYDKSCWVHHIDGFEWIIYAPNLICITANVIFIGNILRILCSKLQAHANEPSNYRKALKATFVLIPLFGLQQFVIIYRPDASSSLLFFYEITQTVIRNTQGAVVSLIFCFFNGEVHRYLKMYIGKYINVGSRSEYNRKGSIASTTQFTTVSASIRRGTRQYDNADRGYIPLSTSSTTNDVAASNGHVTFAL